MITKPLKETVRLYDILVVQREKSIYKGKVCMISEKGVNLKFESGEVKFFKW